MQKVYLSRTESGKFGLFTNRHLAWEFSSTVYHRCQQDIEYYLALCERLRFEPVDVIR
jgi:hypothetical protein